MSTIRLATPADAPQIAEIYAPHVAGSACSFELDPPDAESMAARVEAGLTYAPWLVCIRGSDVAGFAYGSRHRERAAYQWSVDASVYVHSEHQRCGVAGALYTSLFALLRAQCFYAVHAGITLPNRASVGLHESLGFHSIGVYPRVGFKFGTWHDVGWWQLELQARVGEPGAPLSMSELRRTNGFELRLASGLPRVR